MAYLTVVSKHLPYIHFIGRYHHLRLISLLIPRKTTTAKVLVRSIYVLYLLIDAVVSDRRLEGSAHNKVCPDGRAARVMARNSREHVPFHLYYTCSDLVVAI